SVMSGIELQNRLRTLSIDIEQLQHQTFDSNQRGRLDRLKQDQVYPDPLEALPPEIGIMILEDALLQPVASCYALNSTFLLTLTLVSKRWQAIIIDTPSLWATIDIGYPIPDLLGRIAIHIELSQNIPLTLVFRSQWFYWRAVVSMLKEHHGRIKRIAMERIPNQDSFKKVIEHLSPLPQLEEICQIWTTRCPALEHSWNSLESPLIHVDDEILGVIMPILEALPSIENVTLREAHQVDNSTAFKGTVLPIRSFAYHQSPEFLLQLLPRLVNLVTLTLTLPFHVVPKLLKRLEALHFLESLRLAITLSSLRVYPPDLEPLYSITKLHLTIHASSKDLEPFCKSIPRVFPSLSELTFFPTRSTELYVTLHQDSFQKLSKFIFYVGGPIESPINVPSKVKHVQATADLSGTLWTLNSPSATTLTVSIYSLSMRLTLELPSTYWALPSLEHLISLMNPLSFVNHASRTLREIILTAHQTDFCCSLAYRPHSFPVLSSLNLKEIPHWDIFFIMLERRNLFCQSVSPISSVELRLDYPRALFWPIRDLLRQKFPDRPSNREVSKHRISERILDLTIPGCKKCILNSMPCFASTKVSEMGDRGKFKIKLKPYPMQEKDILLSWLDRDEELRSIYARFLGRKEYYDKYPIALTMDVSWIRITKDSDLGEWSQTSITPPTITHSSLDLDHSRHAFRAYSIRYLILERIRW
ncbi:14154_t:CDS:2, partial [Acaulospora colombiana]